MARLGYIQVVRTCNQNCLFCSNPPNERIMPFDEIKKAIDDYEKQGFSGVILTGGEPTLHEQLPEVIRYACEKNITPRIITNGQKMADESYFTELADSGLEHMHISIHSCKSEIQDYLTQTENSLSNIEKTLSLCKSNPSIAVNVNTVINKYNSDHLDETVMWLTEKFPFIRHFVWNNLDPCMNRVEENPGVIPKFSEFELSLYKAAVWLLSKRITFRIERVPLCYMADFAECSTETRKIIKEEDRAVYFLDFRGKFSQNDFFYEKSDICEKCNLNSICAGVYCGEKYFGFDDIYPVFVSKDKIVEQVKGGHN